MPEKIYPLSVAQSNMTMNYTNCFKFFDIVFINVTFTVGAYTLIGMYKYK